MKNRKKLFIISILWLIIIFILYKSGLLTTDINKLLTIINGNPLKMQIIFIFISTIRVLFFIPQTVFILIGSILFGPYIGFILSVISLVLSQSIMYFIGKYFTQEILGENFTEKNASIITIIKTYGYKILALGIVCPITPSDLITASAGCIKLNYKKSISVIVLADSPMIFLYGFLGSGFEESFFLKVFAIIIITFISYYSFVLWNKIKVVASHPC